MNYGNLKTSFFQRVNLLTNVQAGALANPIWDFNTDTITATLNSFKNDPAFVYVAIYDADNKITFSVGQSNQSKKTSITSSPIIYTPQNKVLGKLVFIA